MTNARAGIDVVVAERGAHEFLDEERFLVGASRGRYRADRRRARASPGSAGIPTPRIRSLRATTLRATARDRFARSSAALCGPDASRSPTRSGPSRMSDRDWPARWGSAPCARLGRPSSRRATSSRRRNIAQVVTTLCSGCPSSITDFSINVAVGHACTHAPHETHSDAMNGPFCPGDITDSKPAPVDRQRERALHFLARAHASRAHDALRRIEGEIRIRFVLLGVQMIRAVASGIAPRAARPRPPCPAVRNCRWQDRSGSRADDRRCTTPSRRAAALASAALSVRTFMPAAHGRRAGRRITSLAFYFDQAQTARAERLQRIRRA